MSGLGGTEYRHRRPSVLRIGDIIEVGLSCNGVTVPGQWCDQHIEVTLPELNPGTGKTYTRAHAIRRARLLASYEGWLVTNSLDECPKKHGFMPTPKPTKKRSPVMIELEIARTRWREAMEVYHAYHELKERRYEEAKTCAARTDTAWSEAWSAYNAASDQYQAAAARVVRARQALHAAESKAHRSGLRGHPNTHQ